MGQFFTKACCCQGAGNLWTFCLQFFFRHIIHYNIFCQVCTEHLEVLENNADSLVVVERAQAGNILTMIADGTAARVIESHEQLDEGSFSGTVVAYNGNMLARLNSEGNIIKNGSAAFRILKGHMLKLKLAVAGRNLCSFVIFDARFIAQKGADFIYEHRVFVSLRTKVCKAAHAASQASCTVKEDNCITIAE